MPGIWDLESKPTKKDRQPKKPKGTNQNEEVPFGFGLTAAKPPVKPPARLNVATRHDVDKAAGLAAKFEEFFHNLKLKYSDDGVPESSLNIMFDEIANLHVSLVKSIGDKHLEDQEDKILDALEPALFSGASVAFDDPRLKEIQNECNEFLDKYRSAISSIPLRQRDKRSLVRKFFSFNEVALQVAGAAGLMTAAGALALAQHKLVGASLAVLSDRMADVITKRFIKVSKAISEVPRLDIRLDKTEQSTWASAPVGGVLYPLAKMLLAAVAGAGATYGIMADRLNEASEAREASKASEASKEREVSGKQKSLTEENERLKYELQEALKKSGDDAVRTNEGEATMRLNSELAECRRNYETMEVNTEKKISEFQASKEIAENKLGESEASQERTNEELEELRKRFSENEVEMRTENEHQNSKIQEITAEHAAFITQKHRTEEELTEARSKIEYLEDQLKQVEAQHWEEIINLETNLQTQQDITHLYSIIKSCNEDNEKLKRKIEEAKQKILNQEGETIRHVDQLTTLTEELRQQNTRLQAELNESDQQKTKLRLDLADIKAHNNTLQTTLKRNEEDITTKSRELKESKQHHNGVEEQLRAELKAQQVLAIDLRYKLEETKATPFTTRKDLDILQQQCQDTDMGLHSQITERDDKIRELDAKIIELDRQLRLPKSSSTLMKVQKKIDKRRGKKKELSHEKDMQLELREQNEELLKQSKINEQQYIVSLAQAQVELEKLKRQLESETKAREIISRKKQEIDEDYQNLQTQMIELQNREESRKKPKKDEGAEKRLSEILDASRKKPIMDVPKKEESRGRSRSSRGPLAIMNGSANTETQLALNKKRDKSQSRDGSRERSPRRAHSSAKT